MKTTCLALLFLLSTNTFLFSQDYDGLKTINGTSLYVKIIGKGEPLLIIHGGPGMNSSYLLAPLKGLAKKNKLVFYDQRASGKSATPSPDSISLKFFVDDIEALRKDLGVDKLNILAHSWGTILAVNYGIAYPTHVGHIIFSNPVPMSHNFDAEMLQNQRMHAAARDSSDRSIIIGSRDFKAGKPDAYKKLLLLSFRHSFYKNSNLSSLNLELPENYVNSSKALYQGLGKDLIDYDYYEAAKAISCPVLIIQGGADAIPLGASTKLFSSFTRASLQVFRKSGHFPFIEESGKFNNEVNKFLK